MPDPVTATGLAKLAVAASESDADQITSKLMIRLFGPLADEIGDALARYARFRLQNVGRIVEKADSKATRLGRGGVISPRVAHVVLDQGSLCDDELMAEYLGGALAAGRSDMGRDDRAVTWAELITRLSSFQIRAHFIIYREWAARLAGSNINLVQNADLVRMYLDFEEFGSMLAGDSGLDPDEVVSHSILGLARNDLISALNWAFGDRGSVKILAPDSPYDPVVMVQPDHTGIELYGWAQGISGMNSANFSSMASTFDLDDAIPRLRQVAFPQLDARQAAKLEMERRADHQS